MAHRFTWLKAGVFVVLIILFFVIINGFFAENNKLLEERVFWQEKASAFEDLYNQAQAENELLRTVVGEGLVITGLKLESAMFLPGNGNKLAYSLSVEIKNTTRQNHEAANGFILFSLVKERARSISDLAWRWFVLPELGAGESKTIRISGTLSALPKEEMCIFANILGDPGVAKTTIVLPDRPATSPPLSQKETSKEETKQKTTKQEAVKEGPKQVMPKERSKQETPPIPQANTQGDNAKAETAIEESKQEQVNKKEESAPALPPVSSATDPEINSGTDEHRQEDTEAGGTVANTSPGLSNETAALQQ
ncbi:MAG TPA: hypothetical protein VIL66_02885 [Bacillota bacterium]